MINLSIKLEINRSPPTFKEYLIVAPDTRQDILSPYISQFAYTSRL